MVDYGLVGGNRVGGKLYRYISLICWLFVKMYNKQWLYSDNTVVYGHHYHPAAYLSDLYRRQQSWRYIFLIYWNIGGVLLLISLAK